MSDPVDEPVGDQVAQRRRVWPDVDQLVLRTLVPLGTLTTLVAATAAGGRPPQWLQLVLVGLATWVALRPDSALGILLLLALAYSWARVPETLSPLVLVAAVGLVLTHVAATVAAQGPARLGVDPRQAGRWAGRTLLLWLAAAAVWGLDLLLADLPDRRPAYAAGLVLLTVLAGATTWVIAGGRPPRR